MTLYRILISHGRKDLIEAAVRAPSMEEALAHARKLKAQLQEKEASDAAIAGDRSFYKPPKPDYLISVQRIKDD